MSRRPACGPSVSLPYSTAHNTGQTDQEQKNRAAMARFCYHLVTARRRVMDWWRERLRPGQPRQGRHRWRRNDRHIGRRVAHQFGKHPGPIREGEPSAVGAAAGNRDGLARPAGPPGSDSQYPARRAGLHRYSRWRQQPLPVQPGPALAAQPVLRCRQEAAAAASSAGAGSKSPKDRPPAAAASATAAVAAPSAAAAAGAE